jgi:hypothetical protein
MIKVYGGFGGTAHARGEGGSGSDFAEYIYNGVAYTVTPNEGGNDLTGNFCICTDKPSAGYMSANFSVKSGLKGCLGWDSENQSFISDYQGYVGVLGPSGGSESELLRLFEYDSITGSGGICVKKQIDENFCIQDMWYACYDPALRDCPGDISDDEWLHVQRTTFEADFIGGHDPNVKCEGTLEIQNKLLAIDAACQGDFSTASFMDFLGPSKAYAACYCPPGVKYTSRSGYSYCVCR